LNRTRFIASCVLVTAIALATGCGDLFFVEVEMPEVCNNVADAGFEGLDPALIAAAADAGITVPETTMSYAFDFPLTDQLPTGISDSAEGELSLLSLALTADHGIPDFSFLRKASIEVASTGTGLGAKTLLAYERTAETADDKTILLEGDRFNLMDYMRQGNLNMTISVTGTLPLSEWSATMRACGYLRGRFNYLEAQP